MSAPLEVTREYHERTKHRPSRYAASLGYMDWATQPDPFRRYDGAAQLKLDLLPAGPEPSYEKAFVPGQIPSAALGRASISQLFQDALSLSAWKQAGNSRWALRVNPSSGNLHPTEGYLVAGPVSGLHPRPAVYHYSPFAHALELRAELPEEAWAGIAAQLPEGSVLVGLTSIYWRESWKYGERAFRYCHHDIGHAIGSVAISAAGLGWQATLLESLVDRDLALLLGVQFQTGIEAEHVDGLLAVAPTIGPKKAFVLPEAALRGIRWFGVPNPLSGKHQEWPAIDGVAAATEKLAPPGEEYWSTSVAPSAAVGTSRQGLRTILHQRRSAVALDGRTRIARDTFYRILQRTLPGSQRIPFDTLPWSPCVDLLLFVHRVDGLPPGRYILLRETARRQEIEAAMTRTWAWKKPADCPEALPLYILEEGDVRRLAQETSCGQEIAADGVFAAAMLTDYRASLEAFGPWFYRRLYWETGLIGQVLYLEAEANGIRGTGIGCFFDDLSHQAFGLTGDEFQVLYHFTMGGSIDDDRLQAHPPYPTK
jgi:SagB-type dehydrogenase family enzyme